MEVLMDYLAELNWLAVIVATLASFAVLGLLYSKAVFGRQWMKAANLSKKAAKQSDSTTPLVVSFVMLFVTATALAVLADVLVIDGVVNGVLLGILVAVGFVLSTKIMNGLFELKSAKLLTISATADVISLAIMGGVLGFFR